MSINFLDRDRNYIGGRNAADYLIGTNLADKIDGWRGADTIVGGAGSDWISGGGGNDEMDGGAGFDVVDYSDTSSGINADLRDGIVRFPGRNWGDETALRFEGIIGSDHHDTLSGTNGANWIDGGDGNDVIGARGGNDTILFSGGNDTIYGGSGSDTLVIDFTEEIGGSIWIDEDPHGDWASTEWASQAVAFVNLETGTGYRSDQAGQTTVRAVENVELTHAWNADTVIGNDGANVIKVSIGSNYVEGRGGNDTIWSGRYEEAAQNNGARPWIFNDGYWEELYGNQGDDTIYGSSYMHGGQGNDRLVAYETGFWIEMAGGRGADTFAFQRAPNQDHSIIQQGGTATVADFSRQEGDVIQFYGETTFEDGVNWLGEVSINQASDPGDYGYRVEGSDTVLYYQNTQSGGMDSYATRITLENYTGPVTADMFEFV